MRWLLASLIALLGGCGGEDETGPASGAKPGVDPFCETRPKLEFCEDFDAHALPGSFASSRLEAGGELSVVDVTAPSPPRALSARAGGSASDASSAQLRAPYEAASRLRLFFQVRTGAPAISATPADAVELAEFHYESAAWRVALELHPDGTIAAVEELAGTLVTRTFASRAIAFQEWSSARLSLDFGDATATVSVRIGHEDVLTFADLSPPAELGAPTAAIGLRTRAPFEWNALYDNVTLEAHP